MLTNQKSTEDSTNKILSNINNTAESEVEEEFQLRPLLRRDPHVSKEQGLNFWAPYFKTYQIVDKWIKQERTPENQYNLLAWRISAYDKISAETLAWNRSSCDEPLAKFIAGLRNELKSSFNTALGTAVAERVEEDDIPTSTLTL